MLDARDADEALREVNRALELNPNYDVACALKAAVLIERGDREEALDAANRALELDPENTEALSVRAELLRFFGRAEEAIADSNAFLGLAAPNSFVLSTKGRALLALNLPEEAIKALDKAIELDPGYTFAYTAKADALGLLGRHEEALQVIDSGLAVDPGDMWALGTKALALCESLKLEAAPEDAWAHGMRGWALLHLGRDEAMAARGSYDRAHQLEPDAISWQLGHADALHLLREDAAQEAYQAVVDRMRSISAPDKVALRTLGWALFRLGKVEEAFRVFTKLILAHPAEVETRFDLGLSLLAAGHGETSVVEYERACAAAEARTDRRRRYGLLVVASFDLEDAIEVGAAPSDGASQQVRSLLAEQIRLTFERAGNDDAYPAGKVRR